MAASSPRCSAPGRCRLPLGPLGRRSGLADPQSARPGPLQGPGVLLPPRGARPCKTSRGTGGLRLGPGVVRLRGSLGVRQPTPYVANGFFFQRGLRVMLCPASRCCHGGRPGRDSSGLSVVCLGSCRWGSWLFAVGVSISIVGFILGSLVRLMASSLFASLS